MTKTEALRQARQTEVLQALGFTSDEADKLRRISMTLRRWHELECNGDVQRDETTGKTYAQYGGGAGPFLTVKCADRETAAMKRLAAILGQRNGRPCMVAGEFKPCDGKKLEAYIQGDPRGAALYILRPGDVPAGADVSAYYTRGICVY